MFNFFKAAQEHLGAITVNNRMYISGGKLKQGVTDVNDGLKKNIHISQLIDNFNLEYVIMTRGKAPQLANIDLDAYQANPRKYELRICSDSVQAAGAIIEILSRKYADCIENTQPDANDDSDASTDSEEEFEYEEKAPASSPLTQHTEDEYEEKPPAPLSQQTNILYRGNDICPVIELEDHEKFVDGDRIFEIEIRGERSPEKILFKVEDIAKLFGMSRLSNDILAKELYQEEVHYVILTLKSHLSELRFNRNSHSSDLLPGSKSNLSSDEDSSDFPLKGNPDSSYGKNRMAFLTWFGLFKVLFSSRSGNEYRQKMAKWVMNTMFVHQFGSIDERKLLAETLTMYKRCLNGASGLYLVRIGKVKDLRESMKICDDKYPNDFDNAFVYKYGRSKDVLGRFNTHCSTKNYGAYSTSMDLSWFVILPEEKEKKAEAALSGYFTESNLKFDFTDDSGKEHTELVIIKHDEIQGVREEYIKMINKYPNAENAISLFIDNLKSQYQSQIADLKHENEILKLTHAAELKDVLHQNEIIKLKLEFAEFRLQSNQ